MVALERIQKGHLLYKCLGGGGGGCGDDDVVVTTISCHCLRASHDPLLITALANSLPVSYHDTTPALPPQPHLAPPRASFHFLRAYLSSSGYSHPLWAFHPCRIPLEESRIPGYLSPSFLRGARGSRLRAIRCRGVSFRQLEHDVVVMGKLLFNGAGWFWDWVWFMIAVFFFSFPFFPTLCLWVNTPDYNPFEICRLLILRTGQLEKV